MLFFNLIYFRNLQILRDKKNYFTKLIKGKSLKIKLIINGSQIITMGIIFHCMKLIK